jgi:hypothetical protein
MQSGGYAYQACRWNASVHELRHRKHIRIGLKAN